jgi:hypothetical protein
MANKITSAAAATTSSPAILGRATTSFSAQIINLETDNTVHSSTWYIASASSKSHTVYPVRKYFAYFDVKHHPGMKYYHIYLICCDKLILPCY